MRTPQYIALAVAIALVLLLRLVCQVQAPDMAQAEASRKLNATATSLRSLLASARETLDGGQRAAIAALEEQLDQITEDEARRSLLEELAAGWFQFGHPAISGGYAQQIAEQSNLEADWSTAGTTYTLCLQSEPEKKIARFCYKHAEEAYLNALSLNPNELDHQINLALAQTYNPDGAPMQGIMKLRQLQEAHPDDPRPLFVLAQLALRTNQLERAAERLDQALAIDPHMREAACIRAEIYRQSGQVELAESLQAVCSQPSAE